MPLPIRPVHHCHGLTIPFFFFLLLFFLCSPHHPSPSPAPLFHSASHPLFRERTSIFSPPLFFFLSMPAFPFPFLLRSHMYTTLHLATTRHCTACAAAE